MGQKNHFWLQSLILWVLALSNLPTDKFWYFAIPAVIIGGIDEVLEELRKSNKQEDEQH
jgi:hypothetical protein